MSPPPATAGPSPSRVTHTGGGTASGFQARIIDHCITHGIEISNAKARKLSVRLARRMERQNEVMDWEHALRILGLLSDPTARDAIYRVEGRG